MSREVETSECAAIESRLGYAGHGSRYDCGITAGNDGVGGGFNNGVAIVAAVVNGIALFDNDRSNVYTNTEGIISN